MKKGAELITGVEAIMHTPFKDNYDLDLDGAKKNSEAYNRRWGSPRKRLHFNWWLQ